MLWTYAPLATMDSAGQSRRLRGTGRCGLQVDRCRRRGSLLRPIGSGRPKDLHGNQHTRRLNAGRVHGGRASRRPWHRSAQSGIGIGLYPIFHNVACPRSDFLRRRGRGGAPDSGTGPQGGSGHHLAPERQTTRTGTDEHSIRPAAPGRAAPIFLPRPSRIRTAGNREPATASRSSFVNRRNWGPGSSTTSGPYEPSGRSIWPLNSNWTRCESRAQNSSIVWSRACFCWIRNYRSSI